MRKGEIKIKKVLTRYILTDDKGICISVEVSGDKLNIYRQQYFNQGFEFKGSNPEVVRQIANLLLKATNLIEKNED